MECPNFKFPGPRLCPQDQLQQVDESKALEYFRRLGYSDVLRLVLRTQPRSEQIRTLPIISLRVVAKPSLEYLLLP